MEASVEALVQHLAGSKSQSVLKFCNALLASNLNGDAWSLNSEDQVCAAITTKLADSSKTKAIQFGALHRKLQQRSVISEPGRKAALHCLYLCAGRAGPLPSVVQLSAPAAAPAPPSPGASLMDSTGQLRARVRAPAPGALPSAGAAQAYWGGVPEAAVLQEILYAVQGIEGQYVLLDPISDAFCITEEARVPRGTKDIVRQICEVGWLFSKIDEHVKTSSMSSLLHQSLCASIKSHLSEYYKLLSLLQSELKVPGSSALSMRKLLAWMHEPAKRLKHILIIADGCQDLKGGALASKVHAYVMHGDPTVRSLLTDIMRVTFQPLLQMIIAWATEGELADPFQEFFVMQDKNATDDQFWAWRYSLSPHMIPSFIPEALANKILLIGKSLNFIRTQCGDAQWAMRQEVLAQVPRDGSVFDTTTTLFSGLDGFVTAALNQVNKRLMHLLFVRYKFDKHAHAIKQYLLLSRGDFIQNLMDNLQSTLGRRASEVHKHNVIGILDSAVRTSNADKEWDVLPYLDISLQVVDDRVLTDKIGWDIFCLEYNAAAPLDVVFTKDVMRIYSQLFRFLWKVKRLESSMAQIWRKHMTLGRVGAARGWGWRGAAPVQRLLLQCNALRNDMVHFVYNFQYYLMFEVLEVSWMDFDQKMRTAASLDELIEAHSQYLATLQQAALLTAPMAPIRAKLDAILNVILQFVASQEHLFAALMPFADLSPDTEAESEMDLDDGDAASVASKARSFTRDRLQEERVIQDALNTLQSIAGHYKERFADLLESITFSSKGKSRLHTAPPPSAAAKDPPLHPKDLEFLRYLGFRLDFNEHFAQHKPKGLGGLQPPPSRVYSLTSGTALYSMPLGGQAQTAPAPGPTPTGPPLGTTSLPFPSVTTFGTTAQGLRTVGSAPNLKRF